MVCTRELECFRSKKVVIVHALAGRKTEGRRAAGAGAVRGAAAGARRTGRGGRRGRRLARAGARGRQLRAAGAPRRARAPGSRRARARPARCGAGGAACQACRVQGGIRQGSQLPALAAQRRMSGHRARKTALQVLLRAASLSCTARSLVHVCRQPVHQGRGIGMDPNPVPALRAQTDALPRKSSLDLPGSKLVRLALWPAAAPLQPVGPPAGPPRLSRAASQGARRIRRARRTVPIRLYMQAGRCPCDAQSRRGRRVSRITCHTHATRACSAGWRPRTHLS